MIQTKISARGIVNLHKNKLCVFVFVFFLFFKNKCQWPLERGTALYANKNQYNSHILFDFIIYYSFIGGSVCVSFYLNHECCTRRRGNEERNTAENEKKKLNTRVNIESSGSRRSRAQTMRLL